MRRARSRWLTCCQNLTTDGYVTRFSDTVVPEPAPGSLLGAGLAALAAIRRR